MNLTFDGIVKALRWQAHALAEDREAGYRRVDTPRPAPISGRGTVVREGARGHDDDRSGR
jgi:hypothetical protein